MLIDVKNIRLEYVDNVIIKIENSNKRARRVFACKSTHKRFDLNRYNQNFVYIFFDIILDLDLCAIINQKTYREDIKIKQYLFSY